MQVIICDGRPCRWRAFEIAGRYHMCEWNFQKITMWIVSLLLMSSLYILKHICWYTETEADLNDNVQQEELHCCKHCQKSYGSKKSLRNHMNTHSDNFKCDECGKRCASNAQLWMHAGSHYIVQKKSASTKQKQNTEKSFQCQICHKECNLASNLNVHMRIHSGEKPYHCSHCEKSFRNPSTLKVHECRIHTESKSYKCQSCDKVFKTNADLLRHVTEAHTHRMTYSCRHCNELFQWRGQQRSHLLKMHSDGTLLTCNICQKKFSHVGSPNYW